MKGFNPARPTGTTPEALFDQWVWDKLQTRLISSPTVAVSERGQSISLEAAPAANIYKMVYCKVITLYSFKDYFTVRRWDSTLKNGDGDFAGPEFNVAKCVSAREIASDTIDGDEITYTYITDNLRRAESFPPDDPPQFEYQVLIPRYQEPDEDKPDEDKFVIVARVSNGTGVMDDTDPDNPIELNWVEMEPQRYWAQAFDQEQAGA